METTQNNLSLEKIDDYLSVHTGCYYKDHVLET